MTFVKSNDSAPAGFFEWEAAGLAWLAQAEADGGARCVQVRSVRPGRIELERLAEVGADPSAAVAFGAALARTHGAGAGAFGAVPEGHSGPGFIGRRVLPCRPAGEWGRFYAEQRVRPYLAAAVEARHLTAEAMETVERACDRIAAGDLDDGEPPARVHGDLWNGNVVWTADGAVLIDPAAHGGHRETDLAMLALFGAPHLESILRGYRSVHPLRPGLRDRLALHQLHPLAVHAAGHGPSYGVALERAARAVLALEPR